MADHKPEIDVAASSQEENKDVLDLPSYSELEAVIYNYRTEGYGYWEIYIPSLNTTFDLKRKTIQIAELQRSVVTLPNRVTQIIGPGAYSASFHRRVTLTKEEYMLCKAARDKELEYHLPMFRACEALNKVYNRTGRE